MRMKGKLFFDGEKKKISSSLGDYIHSNDEYNESDGGDDEDDDDDEDER